MMRATKWLPKVFVFYLDNFTFVVYNVFLQRSALGWADATMEGGEQLKQFIAKQKNENAEQ